MPVDRLDEYQVRHEQDPYAHAPMRHDLRNDIVGLILGQERRLTSLERWRYFITGGLAMLALELTLFGGFIAFKLGI